MRQVGAALCVLAIVRGIGAPDVSAQSPTSPSHVGADLGMGWSYPWAVDPPCHDGRPGSGRLVLGWDVHRFLELQVTASALSNLAVSSCGDIVPCVVDQPCPRREGIGKDLKPLGAALVIEPRGRGARVNPRLTIGVGRLIGDGESYALAGAGLRYGDRAGFSMTVVVERMFFRAPVEVFDHWTNQLISASRDGVSLSVLRWGFEFVF